MSCEPRLTITWRVVGNLILRGCAGSAALRLRLDRSCGSGSPYEGRVFDRDGRGRDEWVQASVSISGDEWVQAGISIGLL